MSTCDYCQQDMKDHVGCTLDAYDDFPDGVERPRIKYGDEGGDWLNPEGDCHDCGAPVGTLHHPGCDVERCPLCRGQAISCGCPPKPESGGTVGPLWDLLDR